MRPPVYEAGVPFLLEEKLFATISKNSHENNVYSLRISKVQPMNISVGPAGIFSPVVAEMPGLKLRS